MRQSEFFSKVLRHDPKDETAVNAKLLTRAGFISKNSSGVYTFLPLGVRVIEKIASIIREEMRAIGGQEMLMPALLEKRYLDITGRWGVGIGFEVKGKEDREAGYMLGWTHEEIVTEIMSKYVSSYKDLPFSAYQIQAKFRNEPRAKSGLLRGREFLMKDLYSFHASEDDLSRYYEIVRGAYYKIFDRCGLSTVYTVASGGDFTASITHEFQVILPVGEDTIYLCEKCGYAENEEISLLRKVSRSETKPNDGMQCEKCGSHMRKEHSIEVGNIFPLGTKYSEAFGLTFQDKAGDTRHVVMGSYGIGLGRVMGAIVELHHDPRGIIWPSSVTPFDAHLIELDGASAHALYAELRAAGVDVLYDDREGNTAGEKFAEADLLGIPVRLVVSERTGEKVEMKKRHEKDVRLVRSEECAGLIKETLGRT